MHNRRVQCNHTLSTFPVPWSQWICNAKRSAQRGLYLPPLNQHISKKSTGESLSPRLNSLLKMKRIYFLLFGVSLTFALCWILIQKQLGEKLVVADSPWQSQRVQKSNEKTANSEPVVAAVQLKTNLASVNLNQAVDLLQKNKNDLVTTSILLDYLLEKDPAGALQRMIEVGYTHSNEALEAALKQFARNNPAAAWDIINTPSSSEARLLQSGLFQELAVSSPDKAKTFLSTCDSAALTWFLKPGIQGLRWNTTPTEKVLYGLDILTSAEVRGVDTNSAVYTAFPEIIDQIAAQGSTALMNAANSVVGVERPNTHAITLITQALVKSSPVEAFNWVGKLPDNLRTTALETAISTYASLDLQGAAELAFSGQGSFEDRKTMIVGIQFEASGEKGNQALYDKANAWTSENNVDLSALDLKRPLK